MHNRLCETCEIKTLPEDRIDICAQLGKQIVDQWWFGNPTLALHEVAADFRFVDRPAVSDGEWEAIGLCMAEQSSARCEALAPHTLGNILDDIEE